MRSSVVSETATKRVIRFCGAATPASASPRTSKASCSRSSPRPTPRPRASTAAPAWAWPSPSSWREMMGGEIGVESEDGRGSEFWFTARLRQAAPSMSAPGRAAGRHSRGCTSWWWTTTPPTASVLTAQLLAWGVRPAEAPNGARRLQALYRARDARRPLPAGHCSTCRCPAWTASALARASRPTRPDGHRAHAADLRSGSGATPSGMQEIGFAAYSDQAGAAVGPVRLPVRRAVARPQRPASDSAVIATPSSPRDRAGARCASCWPRTTSPTSRWPWAS